MFLYRISVGAIADHNHYPVCEKGRGELKKKLGKEGKLVGVSTTPSTRNNNGCVIIARSFFFGGGLFGRLMSEGKSTVATTPAK